jgi:glycine/D-amino acid oxidase-like deaminating enzyme
MWKATGAAPQVRPGRQVSIVHVAGRRVLEVWAGLRPCLPDGLPAIGRLGDAIVAAGHAM